MRLPATLVVAVLAAIACAPGDPWEELARSRAAIDVELRSWVESGAPPSGPAEPAAEGEPDPAAQGDDARAEEAAPPREAHLSLLVVDRGARMPLPCLTVDVVLEAGEGDQAREVGRLVRELDISRLADAGGGLDVVLRVPLHDEPVAAIGVARRPATPAELRGMCESEAVRSPAG